LENNFYLKTGWSGEAFTTNNNLIKGKNYNSNTLKKIIQQFNIEVNKYLKKYLVQINLTKQNQKIIDCVEKNYPDTKILYNQE